MTGCWLGSVLVPKVVIWEARNVVFGTLGDDFGDPGVSGDTWQDTLGPRPVFFLIWDGFGGSLGTYFEHFWLFF